ncbi:ATP-binding protein [Rivularia sp. UHCC 0363]|uniref:ATP-binding protein n=1 Tax=Rivularia sp. UHCC 0363 TaxID=3110244 RepID=UPI002B216EDF|nr:ATP-binding protein [Rivularia sp. UHCC 0363]MEA5593853.1 ATP-binding protein [Rivularia sp. UHCC 0363]
MVVPTAIPLNILLLFDSAGSCEEILSLLSEAEFNPVGRQIVDETDYLNYLNLDIEIILADYQHPRLNISIAQQILQQKQIYVPFIVINGKNNASDAVACMKAGANYYLSEDELHQLPLIVKQALKSKTQSPQPEFAQVEECNIYSTELQQRLFSQATELKRERQQSQVESVRREEVEAALRKSQKQLQMLIAKNPDGIVVVDNKGIVRFINPAALKLFNRKEEELLGEIFGFPVAGEDKTEVDIATAHGKQLVAQMRVVKIDWLEKPANLVTLRDITERKQAEIERAELLAKAEAANRVKDEFLAVLSHELRTPLNPILGWTQLLRSNKLPPHRVNQALETIERNAALQAEMIKDLLDVSRILRGKLQLNPISVDLKNIIKAAIETVHLAADAKSIQITTNFSPETALIKGEPNRLQQIFWNLLSNAVKFTPPGGKVHVELTCDRQQVKVQVNDTGKGINSHFLPYVFDYFRQENSTSTRNAGGLGLGLAIVRHLVELHGGKIQVESPGVDKGTTFTVEIPLTTDIEIQIQNSKINSAELNFKGIKILLVDDEPDNLEFLQFVLETYGASIQTATSAPEAFRLFLQQKPDILISDIAMPDVNGHTLIRQIRALPPEKGAKIPAIALTAYAGQTNERESLQSGFNLHLAKPIQAEKLAETIAELAVSSEQ